MRPQAPLRRAPLTLALACVLALTACSTTKNDDPRGTVNVEKLYSDARQDLDNGNWDAAIKAFERVEGRAAGTLMGQQATLDMAYAQWRQGERVQASTTLDRFIKLNPSSPGIDYALYLKGLVNFNDNTGLFSAIARQDMAERDQQASRDAWQAFDQLVTQHPNSKYADDARQRMDYIVNALASHETHVARYYFRRGAYAAAAARAQNTVREYQRSPAVEEALYIMFASYDKLGLEALRDDAARVLKSNFPNTKYFERGVRRQEQAWWQFW